MNLVSMFHDGINYRDWRRRILSGVILGYAFFYMVRQNWSVAVPHMIRELGYSREDIGWIVSSGAIVYALGKGIFGFLVEKVSARILMSIGLGLTSITCICIGFNSNITGLFFLCMLSQCFQSTGAAPCIRILANWFSAKELATKWSIWNASQQIGGGLTVVISGYVFREFGWRYIFFVPGMISLFGAVWLWRRIRDNPKDLGFPSADHIHGLTAENMDESRASFSELYKMIFKNPLVWCMSIANFFVYFVRMSFFNWGPMFLHEAKGSGFEAAGYQTAFFDITGIIGGILAGTLSDRYFRGYRGRVAAICMFLLAFAILLLWKSPSDARLFSKTLHFLSMGLVGLLITGPQILAGVGSADFASKRAAAAANGFTGIFGYFGGAASGAGIALLVKGDNLAGQWDYVFICMVISSLISATCFAVTWHKRSKTLES